jgi:lipoate-protein ligase A
MSNWRFLNTGAKDGYHNMAIDEVLATKSVLQDKMSIFRVYRWQPFTISLGYNQDPNDLDLEKCKRDKIDVVRRPTGGRAVFHAEEVTYSIIIPKDSEFYSADILTTYNRINKGILNGLHLIGVKAELVERSLEEGEKSSAYKDKIPCFSKSAKFEIAFQGKKLVGSAQRRYENSILQHGSILIGTFHLRIAEYIKALKGARVERFQKALAEKTISISQILPTKINYERIMWAIKTGFQKSFNIYFFEGQLTPHENIEVQKLVKKYQKLGGRRHEN